MELDDLGAPPFSRFSSIRGNGFLSRDLAALPRVLGSRHRVFFTETQIFVGNFVLSYIELQKSVDFYLAFQIFCKKKTNLRKLPTGFSLELSIIM